jgi:hypothetical protein
MGTIALLANELYAFCNVVTQAGIKEVIDFKNARSGKLKKDKLGNVRRQHFWRLRCYFHATPKVSFILELFKCSLNRSTFLFLSCWLIYLDRQLLVGLSRSGNYLVKVAMSFFLNFSR